MSTGEIRDSEAIRVCFEFRDSYLMDVTQIKCEPLISSWLNAKFGLKSLGKLYIPTGKFDFRCHLNIF